MLRIPGIILFILCVCCFTHAQHLNLKPARLVEEASRNSNPTPVSPFKLAADRNQADVPGDIQEYSLLQLDRESLTNLSGNNFPYITLSIPQEGRSSIALELVEVSPFAEGFRIVTAPSMTPVKLAHGKHYRGIISGQPGSVAAVSFFEDEIMGFIAHPAASGNIIIGKLEDQSSHIVYQDDQIASRFTSGCDTEASDKKYTPAQLRGEIGHSRSLSDCVRLYLEADHDIYLNKGSNTGNVTNFVTGIFNQVSTLYANEQINTIISELVIWTQPSPYNATTTIGMLNAFTAYRQGFNGDLAQLLSYKVGGGVAYIDGLCRPNPDFSMSYSGITSTYQNVPTYSWTVEVCAHEFGHLFGSQHTHACVWNGNNTAIDGCFTTEGGCPSPGLPSGGGTVMSYCHLTSAGINFANGFGVQPGNVMRYEVTNASCLQACPGGGGDGGGGNPCTENVLTLELRTDNYPAETTWNIKNAAGAVLYSGGPYATPNTLNTVNLCLPTGCYTFTINDSYGDGICCTYGSGFYKIKQGSTTLIQGGQFASSEMKPFCAAGSGPSCTDGIQNGQETGIDCGGPNCPACPTCTDGIQNGQETGIDCGGPTCPACPTCTDGIQNGQETGIDCGGPVCQPCQTNGGVTITQLAGHYFETGWDGWIDGGVDCARLNTASAPEGSFAIQLRDNDGTFSSMTSPFYNLTQYDSVTVEFKFRALSFEPGEDFWLRYSNGSTWTTVKAWVTPADFVNNTVYTRKVRLNAPLASNAQFRFQSDASDNFDQVLIDAVVIKGYKTTGTPPVATCTDGIQNGQETGIDCGGPACPACPTCTDGIQNGQETGVDCGGPVCAPCNTASCTDGIQNGQETGIDCGGPTCPACPTCNDGIQNGQETGIDCGGPICQPCQTNGGVTITQLAGHYFETGWDGWIDGGVDCARLNTASAPEGSFAIQLRDNDGTFSSMTSPFYNLTQYDSVTVEFKFRALSFEPGEDFWLRYSNGSTWTTVKAWVTPADFVNNTVYTRKVRLNAPLASNAQFRFQSDASDNFDQVLIDAVVIKGYKSTGTPPVATCTDGIQNGQETGIDCGGPVCPACPTCTDGLQNGQESGVDCGGPSCPACPSCTDGIQNGQETGVDCGGPACPPCNTASCTDGIQNGQETGIDCGGPACPACPTCTDGIQNGQETGVDCGGPVCAPCNTASCTDGIQNGMETGIDCGGPTCPVCPTCTDGIQNGQETGVDCGGPVCTPCNNGGNPVTIFGHYFETGWDGWIDGGSDCFRYAGPQSPEGTYSIRLRDNSGDQSAMVSGVYNLSPYNLVTVVFSFRASGMETGEDFWLQISDGTAWSTVATFVSGSSFMNNQLYTVTVNMNGPFSNQSKFRFQCDASENDDNVYIDAVVVTASSASGLFEVPVLITPVGAQSETDRSVEHQVTIYPNPATEVVRISSSNPVGEVQIFSTDGKLIKTSTENDVNISELNPGVFILRIRIQDQWMVHKIIKQ